MKVLVVRPKAANTLGYLNVVDTEPLELEYLYTVLRDYGAEACIYDALLDHKALSRVLLDEQPDVICITGYITQRNLIRKYGAIAKRRIPGIKVIAGGVFAELTYAQLYDDNIDYIIHTSSLKTFIEVIRCIDQDRETAIPAIKGICYRQADGTWHKNDNVIADINDLPIPDRSYFYRTMNRYKYLDYKPCASVKTTYSCPYACSFCYCRKLNSGRYSARDMRLVIEEIKSIQCDNIYVVDDDFLFDKSRLETFITLIEKNGIRKNFLVYGRADFVANNKTMMMRLKKAGVCLVMVGLESMVDAELENYNKKSSRAINEACIRVLRECNITCMGFLMVDQNARKSDFAAVAKWMETVDLTYISVAIHTPLPGSDIYENYRDQFIDTKIQHFDFLHCMLQPKHMSLRAYYRECHKLYRKIFRIAKRKGAYAFLDLQYYRGVFDHFFRTLMKE